MRLKPKIGVIGAGVMGLAICQRFLQQGFAVLVHDIAPERDALAAALGAQILPSAFQVVQQAQVIFVVVLDAVQISEVFSPKADPHAGLLRGITMSPQVQSGQCPVVLLCSTIAPKDAQRFANQVQEAGAWVLDAPISGGPKRACEGSMSIMLSGSEVAIAQAQTALDVASNKQFFVSSQLGDAMRAKLVNNLMAASNLIAAAQAMSLANAFGLDLDSVAQIVSASSGQSWMCDDRIERALQSDMTPRAQLHVLTKDVTLACTAARELNISLPIGEVAAQLMNQACLAGHKADDDAVMFQYLSQGEGI
jgi:L-threonate 2-dehydrogenase